MRRLWDRHVGLDIGQALLRLVETVLLPVAVFWTVRPFGLTQALLAVAGWHLLVSLSHMRKKHGWIALLAMVGALLRAGVTLISPTMVLWTPVVTGILGACALHSPRWSARLLTDAGFNVANFNMKRLSAIWSVEQVIVCCVNATLIVFTPAELVISVRPVVGLLGGTMAVFCTWMWSIDRSREVDSDSADSGEPGTEFSK